LPKPTANTSPRGLYLQHSTYSSQSLKYDKRISFIFLSDLFFSTYTTFANSKSPNIRCFGRFSTTFAIDIRRARVVLGAVDDEASLPANDIGPFRSPKNHNYKIQKNINNDVKHLIEKLNAPDALDGVVIVS
jgi:hypothetical protein